LKVANTEHCYRSRLVNTEHWAEKQASVTTKVLQSLLILKNTLVATKAHIFPKKQLYADIC